MHPILFVIDVMRGSKFQSRTKDNIQSAESKSMFDTAIEHINRILAHHTALVPSVDAHCRKHVAELALEQPLERRCRSPKGTTERINYIVMFSMWHHIVVPIAISPTPAHVRGDADADSLDPWLRSDAED